jgi:hypothetical protein
MISRVNSTEEGRDVCLVFALRCCGREMVTCVSDFQSTFDSRRPVMRDLVPRQRPFS